MHAMQHSNGACTPFPPFQGYTRYLCWGSQGGTRRAAHLPALMPSARPVRSRPAHSSCSMLLLTRHLPGRPPIPAERRGSMPRHSHPGQSGTCGSMFLGPRHPACGCNLLLLLTSSAFNNSTYSFIPYCVRELEGRGPVLPKPPLGGGRGTGQQELQFEGVAKENGSTASTASAAYTVHC